MASSTSSPTVATMPAKSSRCAVTSCAPRRRRTHSFRHCSRRKCGSPRVSRPRRDAARTRCARLDLTATELEVVWLLAALAVDSAARALFARAGAATVDPTLDFIRAFVYGDRPSRLALSELSATGTLRRLGLIERSDGGSAELHESRGRGRSRGVSRATARRRRD